MSMEVSQAEMERRYTNAQALLLAWITKSAARNTTLIPHWIGETNNFWYVRELKDGQEFRLVDADARTNETAFDHEVLAKALEDASGQTVDARNLPISKLEFVSEMSGVMFDAFDKRWQFSLEDGGCVEPDILPREWIISPDGARAAFLRGYNLWIKDLESGEERQLTHEGFAEYAYAHPPASWGMPQSKVYATPEAVWSPDSTMLFTLQVDKRSVKSYPIVEYAPRDGSLRPRHVGSVRVAHPADESTEEYRFLAIDVATGNHQEAHYQRVPVFRNAQGYFSTRHGWWSEDSRYAYFIDIVRGGDHTARFVEFDTHSGRCRVLIEEETPDTFFKLRLDSRSPIHPRPLPGSDDMLWFSERTGWGHLYLYDMKTGALKNAITQGDWVVRDIHHWDPERRELIVQTAGRVEGRHAYYRDVCRVNVDTGVLTEIVSSDDEYVVFDDETEMGGNLSGIYDVFGAKGVSRSGDYVVATRSRVDTAPTSILLDRNGREQMNLEAADLSGLPEGWQWPEPVKLKAADGHTDIYANVFRPTHFDEGESYPIIDISGSLKESVYFPSGAFTNNSLAAIAYFNCAALAELGFVVVDIYGRGTPNRSTDFLNDPNSISPAGKNQADRIAAIRQLADRYSFIDIDRVGAGGSTSWAVAASALLGDPDFYKVGVLNGGLLDWRMSPAFWGESYGDLPGGLDDYKPIYDYAKNLKGKLLITHGMMNSSVPESNAFMLIDALQQANRNFDMLVLPNDGYGTSSYAQRRTWDYFVTHLLGAEPPENFDLVSPGSYYAERKAKQMASVLEQDQDEK